MPHLKNRGSFPWNMKEEVDFVMQMAATGVLHRMTDLCFAVWIGLLEPLATRLRLRGEGDEDFCRFHASSTSMKLNFIFKIWHINAQSANVKYLAYVSLSISRLRAIWIARCFIMRRFGSLDAWRTRDFGVSEECDCIGLSWLHSEVTETKLQISSTFRDTICRLHLIKPSKNWSQRHQKTMYLYSLFLHFILIWISFVPL